MAVVMRGKNKGKWVVPTQWCNDWVMASGEIYLITALKFAPAEFTAILATEDLGAMKEMFVPDYELRMFKRRKYEADRRVRKTSRQSG